MTETRLDRFFVSLLILTGVHAVFMPPAAGQAPATSVVNVASESALQQAVAHLGSNTTIVIAPGTYHLTSTLWVNGSLSNIGIMGGGATRDDVVLVGKGMANGAYGDVPFGIWTGGGVQGVTIANLTIRDVFYHPIIFNGGTQSPRVSNVRLVDAGEQFIKSNPDASGGGVNNGIVENSLIEYTQTSKDYYTNGVDVHAGANWVIRDTVFRNIVAPPGQLAGPAILVWNRASQTLVEGNTFLNCARGISFGLENKAGHDHSGGIIRNNMIHRSASQPGDVGIMVADSPNTQVLNNTVFLSGTYGSPIEYRFSDTTMTLLANNLLDGIILARDGATGAEQTNITGASASMFVNAAAGDLHLAASAQSAIDRGTIVAAVVDDWDGHVRPQGNGYDIGADERIAAITTYRLEGRVVGVDGAGMAGAVVTLNGARQRSTTTDANGRYAFTGLPGGDYAVTSSKKGYAFKPASLTFPSLAANQTAANFSAARPPTVALTSPGAGATFVASATITVTATVNDPDANLAHVKFYAGTKVLGSDDQPPYAVTWRSVPAGTHSLVAVAIDVAGGSTKSATVNISVVPSVQLAGRVVSAGGAAVPGVSIALSGGRTQTSTTDAAGAFSFPGLPGGDYRLTPSKPGYNFTPPSLTVTGVFADRLGATFTANQIPAIRLARRAKSGGFTAPPAVPRPFARTVEPLVQAQDLLYSGAFRLPMLPGPDADGFAYAGGGVAYHAPHDSLFLAGFRDARRVGEITIPRLSISSNLGDLSTAMLRQPLVDPSNGRSHDIAAYQPLIGGLLVSNDDLIVNTYSFYDAMGQQVLSVFRSSVNWANLSTAVKGPFQVGTAGAGFVSGYMAPIPTEWQPALGGPAFAGQCCIPIVSRTSLGPSVSVFNPADVGVTSPVPATMVLGYPHSQPTPANWAQTNPFFNGSTQISGVVFPNGTRSVLFFGRHGVGTFCYGTGGARGGDCYDPADIYQGTHGYPYEYQVWAYDALDLVAVKNGSKQPWEVRPYDIWTLDLPFASPSRWIGGATYDPVNRRLFVVADYGDGALPIVHVFTLP